MRTGLPLYVVGTSTYGVSGGLIMPGFVMGLLQFGWLAVNAAGVAALLCTCFGIGLQADGIKPEVPGLYHGVIAGVFAIAAAFMGLKGIQYVARVATFLPLIPLAVLVLLFARTAGGLGSFSPSQLGVAPETPGLGLLGVVGFMCVYVVGFFATAGAAGTDIASSSRNAEDVRMGGLAGIATATVVAGGLTILIVAGAYGTPGLVPEKLAGNLNPVELMKGTKGMNNGLLSENISQIIMILLAISSFPAACFSAFIAANSFKTTMPKVNPFISVGLGTIAAIILAVTGVADKVVSVFLIIGASFGPVCGAMVADYLLAGRKWAGPRAGFNPAGWISWVLGFVVGAADFIPGLAGKIPAPPVAAFLVGFVLYVALAKAGLESKTLDHPAAR
jgi:cytosine permease